MTLLLVTLAVTGRQLFIVREKDRATYLALVESSRPQAQKGGVLANYSHQKREKVTKEFWLNQEERLKYRLASEHSSLFLFPEKGNMDVIEEMEDVTCLMQEVLLDNDKQELRYFEAEKATYNYTTQLFVAEEVKIWKYQVTGHELPDVVPTGTPIMSGVADRMNITLKGGDIKMNANNFRATFDPKEERL